jgi:tetratricopeptide (TPR) repeat protein
MAIPDLSGAEPQVRSAIESAHRTAIQDSSDAGPIGHYAMILDAHGFTDEALQVYASAAAIGSDDFRWRYHPAVILQTNDPVAAIPHFEACLRIDPNYAPMLVRFAQTLRSLGRQDEAFNHFKQAAAIDPGQAAAHLGIGQILLSRGALAEARAALLKAIELNPDSTAALSDLSRVCRRLNLPEDARRYAEASRKVAGVATYLPDPKRFEIDKLNAQKDGHLTRSEAYRRMGRHAEALGEINRLLSFDPQNTSALTQAARLHGQLGNFAAAADVAQRAHQIDPDSPNAAALLAAAAFQLGDNSRSKPAAIIAVKSDPANAEMWRLLGRIAMDEQDHIEAIRCLRRSLDHDPANPDSKFHLGKALSASGAMEEAVAVFVELTSNHDAMGPEPWLRLGLAQMTLDRHDDAIPSLENAIRAAPSLEPAIRAYARCLAKTNRGSQAVAILRTAIERKPDSSDLALELAWILATHQVDSIRNGPDAVKYAQRAIDLAGPLPSRLDTLAAAYAEVGRFDDAVDAMRQAIDALTKPETQATDAATFEKYEARINLYQAERPYRDEG